MLVNIMADAQTPRKTCLKTPNYPRIARLEVRSGVWRKVMKSYVRRTKVLVEGVCGGIV